MSGRNISLDSLAPGVPVALPGFQFPAPRHPAYLRQERSTDIEALMPLARAHLQHARTIFQGLHADPKVAWVDQLLRDFET